MHSRFLKDTVSIVGQILLVAAGLPTAVPDTVHVIAGNDLRESSSLDVADLNKSTVE
jgi:hypothetical protein